MSLYESDDFTNLFEDFDVSSSIGDRKVFVLIIYDIVDDRRRTSLAKKLQGYGFRVQKSAFEAVLRNDVYQKLLTEVPKLIDQSQDSVRIYKMRRDRELCVYGISPDVDFQNVYII